MLSCSKESQVPSLIELNMFEAFILYSVEMFSFLVHYIDDMLPIFLAKLNEHNNQRTL